MSRSVTSTIEMALYKLKVRELYKSVFSPKSVMSCNDELMKEQSGCFSL